MPPVDSGSTAPAMAAPPSAPSLGGLPDVGSGLSGLGQQLADAFGGLLGSAEEGLADTHDPPPEEPASTPVPPPPEPAPPPSPAAATETPCEIAADELPQVGE